MAADSALQNVAAAEAAMAGAETRVTYRRTAAAAIDRVIGWLTEPLAALLVLIEVVILASGVFTRCVLAMGVGLFSPPLGVGYYGACAIGRANPDEAVVPRLPYLGALVLALLVIAFVPWISLGFLHLAPGQ